jgi:hypothetical protein|tara:strand:+ start:6904 stop:7161 length:258 start_codon:yes stop_codon:yes gene_type:complete
MSENQQPNINNNQGESQSQQARGYISNDMADFSFLIGLVMDYYYSKDEPLEEGEEWKKDSKEDSVDEEVDKAVKKAFLAKLNKHQ